MYVQRDADGKILIAYAMRQPGLAEEYLSEDDPELADFYRHTGELKNG